MRWAIVDSACRSWQRQRLRVEHEEQHRLIARVDLLVRRRRRHRRLQLARRLAITCVLGGGVDVAAQVELNVGIAPELVELIELSPAWSRTG
jgi:hypothetical protein